MGKLQGLGRVDLGRRATYQDLLDAPDDVVAELIDGLLYTQARPRPRHGTFQIRLSSVLVGAFEDGLGTTGGWRILSEPDLHLLGNVLVPDLAGWRSARYPADAGDVVGLEVAPDWVCEILSPSTQAKDRIVKLPRYAKAGIDWAWLVDPLAQSIEVYQRARDTWTLAHATMEVDMAKLPPFESLELPLAQLWHPQPDEPAP